MEKKSHLERNDFVHEDVERLGGDLIDKLEVEADADALDVEMLAEETVVVASAATDAVAIFVEGHARDDDQVEIAMIRFVLRLKDVEVAHGDTGVMGVFHWDDVVADHSGQDDLFFQVPFVKEGLGLHLVGQGAVEHDPLGSHEVGMLFQLGEDLLRLFQQLFFGMLFFQGLDLGPQFFFVHVDESFGKSKKQS